MSLDNTLCAISTWRCVLDGKAGMRRSTAASSSRNSNPTCSVKIALLVSVTDLDSPS